MSSDDRYTCQACGTHWCVAVLAAECCSPERVARLKERKR